MQDEEQPGNGDGLDGSGAFVRDSKSMNQAQGGAGKEAFQFEDNEVSPCTFTYCEVII